MKALCERYLASDRFAAAREATRHQFNQIVKVEILPALGDRQLAAIEPADLADWAQGIIDRGAPVTANQSFKILRLIWNWGRKRLLRDRVPLFPLAGYGRPWDGERPRKRHLSTELMKKFIAAVDEEPRMTAVWWLLMVLNLTRKTETCLLEKSEIVLEEPARRLPHRARREVEESPGPVPAVDRHTRRRCCDLALEHSGESTWVMPGKKDKPRFQRTGVPGSRVSKRIGAQVSPHDLRHTVATMLGELGVEPHVIDALQNHRLPRSTDVDGHLQRRAGLGLLRAEAPGAAALARAPRQEDPQGTLNAHIRQAVDGKKQFEEAMKLNMKLGPHSKAHKMAVQRRRSRLQRERDAHPEARATQGTRDLDDHTQLAYDGLSVEFVESPLFTAASAGVPDEMTSTPPCNALSPTTRRRSARLRLQIPST